MDINTIDYTYWNERDIEIPFLVDFIKNHPDIVSALDVGAHWSWSYYAPQVRKLVKTYDAVDILPDEQTARIVDSYTVGNVLDMKDVSYDLVFCISSLEHAGISTYHVDDYKEEQRKVFAKLFDLSKKYVYCSFPFGKEALHKGEFSNITEHQLKYFYNKVKDTIREWSIRFYFSEFPQGRKRYKEIGLHEAKDVEYVKELGNRCICFLEAEKI